MTLQKKTILIIIFCLILLISGIELQFSQARSRGYLRAEETQMQRNMQRGIGVYENELKNMKVKASDWAAWDDTYQFIQDANNDYVEANLNANTLKILHLTSMIFLTREHTIVWGKTLDPESATLTELDTASKKSLLTPTILNHLSTSSEKSGAVVVDDTIKLVVSLPVIKTDQTGPIIGTLIFVQNLDAEKLAEFSSISQLTVSAKPALNPPDGSDFQTAVNNLQHTGQTYVMALGDNEIAAYTLINTLNKDNPGFVLKVTNDRAIYGAGLQTIRFVEFVIIFIAILLSVISYFLFDRFILRRLRKLNHEIHHMIESKNFTLRLREKGNDEFALFIKAINTLLDTISDAQQEQQNAENDAKVKSDEREKALSQLSDKVAELERLNKAMVDRELKMVEMKRELNKAKKESK